MKFTDAKKAQRANDGCKRGRVDQEDPSGTHGGHEDSGNCRTDHPRGVERCGIQCDCVRQVSFDHQIRDEGLACWCIERRDAPQQ
jgi:hypothetical protein